MKVYFCKANDGRSFYTTASSIGEARVFARYTFGYGVSFSIREATIEEATRWLNGEVE